MNEDCSLVWADVDVARVLKLGQKVKGESRYVRTGWQDKICDYERRLVCAERSIDLVKGFLHLREVARTTIDVEKLTVHVRSPRTNGEF